jgi:hypothetical protein
MKATTSAADGRLRFPLQGRDRQHDGDGDDDQRHADGTIRRRNQRLKELALGRDEPVRQAHRSSMHRQRQTGRRGEHQRRQQPVRNPSCVAVEFGKKVAKGHGDQTMPVGPELPWSCACNNGRRTP